MKKKITVCIQSYNHDKYIEECIQSILNQTYKKFNIIIFDDGSTDETLKIVKKIISNNKNKKICLIKTNSPKNHTNFNNILRYHKFFGEYFTIFHSDDIYEPNILEEQIKFMDANQDVMMTGTSANLINEKNKHIGTINTPYELKKVSKINNLKFVKLLFNFGFFLMTPSFIYRANFLKKKIFFNYKNFGWAADVFFFYTSSKYNSIGFINKRLLNYRISNKSLSENLRKNNLNTSDLFKVLKKILKEGKFSFRFKKLLVKNYNFLLMLNHSNINLNRVIKGKKKLKNVKLIKNITLALCDSFKFKRFIQATIIKMLCLSSLTKYVLIYLNKLRQY
jgi:glycosyltransferase involved in cell wall biosynthesis